MNLLLAKKKIEEYLLEDIGTGDLSTDSIFSENDVDNGAFIAKQDGIICGLEIPNLVYELLGGKVIFTPNKTDGDIVKAGEIIGTASGSIKSMLTGERVILNLMQRMSGIATITDLAVNTLDDPKIKICDTRKTAPGLRIFDKYSVRMGGGYNHRVGLYDGVMLKDNHIKEFAKHVPSNITTEISGGINLQNINSYKGTNADYISLGFLTHSIKALDISFNNTKGEKVWGL